MQRASGSRPAFAASGHYRTPDRPARNLPFRVLAGRPRGRRGKGTIQIGANMAMTVVNNLSYCRGLQSKFKVYSDRERFEAGKVFSLISRRSVGTEL